MTKFIKVIRTILNKTITRQKVSEKQYLGRILVQKKLKQQCTYDSVECFFGLKN